MTMRFTTWCRGLAAAAAMAITAAATADCPIDFEDQAANTAITTQYFGVRFSGVNPDGTAGPDFVIWTPAGGTTSPTKCLGAQGSQGEFSVEFLRMEFAVLQKEVTFNLGVHQSSTASATVQVRRYSNSNVLLGTQTITLLGNLTDRVTSFVRVGSASGARNIRRVEVQVTAPVSGFEFMDDLTFERDLTPPLASITGPSFLGCECPPVAITGTAADPDGVFESYTLEYASDPNSPWTLISTSTTPVIGGLLGTWSTSLVQDYYLIRLTVNSMCGQREQVVTAFLLDRFFDPITITSPSFPPAAIVGGTVCLEGTVADCRFDHYTVQYAAIPGGVPIGVIDPGTPSYTSPVTSGTIAQWDTVAGPTPVADGVWRLIVTGTDTCAHTRGALRDFIVDNTPPLALITAPGPCGFACGLVPVMGTASDAHIASWALEYTGGPSAGWTTIAGGTANVVAGALAVWDTTGLPACAYTLRLVVADRSSLDCGAGPNTAAYEVSLNIGSPGDFNRDGAVNSQDFFDFLNAFFAPIACP